MTCAPALLLCALADPPAADLPPAPDVPERFRNPWPAELEAEFRGRGRRVLAALAAHPVSPGNTYFENEKRTYGYLMARALTGDAAALADLQREDAQADRWHRHTAGIDFYPSFTLKHQARKYFLLGDRLAPDYRRRMAEGAKAWTARDPLRRPHHAYQPGKSGWGPDAKNSWVDVRDTDNLWVMRTTSVYLFAAETGNAEVAALYKRKLLDYAAKLYRSGLGEWDSENYLGHCVPGLLNVYDFSGDPEAKLAAKACLDWLSAAAAVKYDRGAFNGPTKRDYNHPQPFGGSAANLFWVWFGGAPLGPDGLPIGKDWESDEVHLLTSAYRPPAAVVALARKRFAKPVELFASKAEYWATTRPESNDPPAYLETQYFGETYQFGSLAGGTGPDRGDVNGFKLLARDADRGAVALQGVPGPDPLFVGSPQYQPGKLAAVNRVGQYRRLAVWLVKDGRAPWRWVVPGDAAVSEAGGVTFLEFDDTWVALRPLGTGPLKLDAALTAKVAGGEQPRFPGCRVLATAGDGSGGEFCGVAVEVGEPATHGTFAAFRAAALAAEVDAAGLTAGVVRYRATDGTWLGFHWHDDPRDLGVWRNGARHDWAEHARWLYRPADGSRSDPIRAAWGGGALTVEAGGARFRGAVGEDGAVTFENGPGEHGPGEHGPG